MAYNYFEECSIRLDRMTNTVGSISSEVPNSSKCSDVSTQPGLTVENGKLKRDNYVISHWGGGNREDHSCCLRDFPNTIYNTR